MCLLLESLCIPLFIEVEVSCPTKGMCDDNDTVLVERNESFFDKYKILSASVVTRICNNEIRIKLANFTPQSKFLPPGTIVANLSNVSVNEFDADCEFVHAQLHKDLIRKLTIMKAVFYG